MNPRAEARIDELGLGGFPTTFFDGGYGQVVGGDPNPASYAAQIVAAGPRIVSTDILDMSVSMTWLGGAGSRADDIEVTVSITVLPGLTFDYPDGIPELTMPGQETTFGVSVVGSGIGVPISGTGQLHYSLNGGALVSVAMAESAPNEYEAVLPALDCGDFLDFYFSAEEQTLGVLYDHQTTPFYTYPINEIDALYFDDFEGTFDWTISGGQWAHGTPRGQGGQYGNPDPNSSYSGSNELGYNLYGDYGPNLPQYHATSPAIDCSDIENIELSFMRWLNVESPSYDHAYIKVSNNGSNWTTIWENTDEITDDSWTRHAYNISAIADNQPTVFVRFTMGVTDGLWQYSGWNIDDVSLTAYNCNMDFAIVNESLPDWTEGLPYSQTLTCVYPSGEEVWADRDGDLVGTGLSLSTDGVISGTPISAGSISFVAQVTDETPDTAEKTFTFMVNPPVSIMTTTLPGAIDGQPYTYGLAVSGGTGTIEWTEIGDVLSGAGLTLSAGGAIDGTPVGVQTVNFTVAATDQVGAADESALTIYVIPAYLCGDIDNDGIGPNIVDLIYLVTYMFQGGPEPPIMESTDADGNDVGPDIMDLIFLVTYMFQGGPELICDDIIVAAPDISTSKSVTSAD